ncbi:MAG: hypothetical protein KAW14_05510, partial [Candidatus Aegiribacteria sp.]|nr:hypothetical protein [Candidatus Aegiribacteria sp.]
KNVIIFCGALVLRIALVMIEVFFNFTGFALHTVYAILILFMFVLIWLVNYPLVAKLKSKVLQFLSCSGIALLLTGLFVLAMAIQGTLFKTFIKGSF